MIKHDKNKVIRIATRASKLAIWQAELIGNKIKNLDENLTIEYILLSTKGDEVLDRSLASIGGKAVFVKNLEQALLDDRADIAVHSLKDVPSELDNRFTLAMFSEREDPRDALLSNNFHKINDLPKDSIIGTSSPRRVASLRAMGFNNTRLLRGNIARRIKLLANSKNITNKSDKLFYDAIIIANAALIRLKLRGMADDIFTLEQMTPAPGQGVVTVECLSTRDDLIKFFQLLDHKTVRDEVSIERYITAALGGDCHSPIGMFAYKIKKDKNYNMYLQVMIGPGLTLKNSKSKYQPNINYTKKFNFTDLTSVDFIIDELIALGAKKLLQNIRG